jgi:hypothetical protein
MSRENAVAARDRSLLARLLAIRERANLFGQREDLPREVEQLDVLLVSSCTVTHCWSAITWRFASARFWEIITKVERKIASSETIIVSRPKG